MWWPFKEALRHTQRPAKGTIFHGVLLLQLSGGLSERRADYHNVFRFQISTIAIAIAMTMLITMPMQHKVRRFREASSKKTGQKIKIQIKIHNFFLKIHALFTLRTGGHDHGALLSLLLLLLASKQ